MSKMNNDKGITVIESLIAVVLTAIAIISLMPMQSISLTVGTRADYMGRAAYLMQSELEAREYAIMNQNISITLTPTDPFVTKYTVNGALTASAADTFFTVRTFVNTAAGATNAWIVHVQVTWPGGPASGVRSSIIATGHYKF